MMALRVALRWASIQTLVRVLLGFFSAKVSAIYLGPAGMVLIGQLNSFIQVAQGTISNGANTGVVNLTAERKSPGRLHQLWGTAMRLVLALGGIFAFVSVLTAVPLGSWLLFSERYWPVIIAASLVVVLAVSDNIILGALNGLKQVGLIAKVGIISAVIEFCLFVSLTYNFGIWGGLCGIVGIYVAKFAISCTFAFRSGLVSPRALLGAFDARTVREIAKFYPMLIVHSIALPLGQILVRSGTVAGLGLEQGGYLQAVWRLSDMYVGVLTTALGLYFMANFSALTNDAERGAMLRRTMLQMFGFTVVAALAIYLLREVIIAVVLTRKFMPMSELLPFQLLGNVFKMVDYPLQMALVCQRRMSWYIAQAAGGPAIFVILSHVWLPMFGAQAAPAAYAVSYLVVLMALGFASRRLLFTRNKINEAKTV
jgi:O-antigen/teichoic acid export membrane protein